MGNSVAEGPDHWTHLRKGVNGGAVGPKIHDARIAALCAGVRTNGRSRPHGEHSPWSRIRRRGTLIT